MNKLRQQGNSCFITEKRHFSPVSEISRDDLDTCLEFAYGMTFGGQGEHRDHRTGGRHSRKNGELFINTFQGKTAEFALHRFLRKNGINCPPPDVDTWGLGQWDSCDLTVGQCKLNVKSTKFFGNLLLLETKDWNSNGQYLPNLETGDADYDFFLLLRLRPDGEKLMKNQRLYYSDSESMETIRGAVLGETWDFDVPGYVDHATLVRAINAPQVLPQRALLNGKVPMDAENYYLQAGDMKRIEELLPRLRQ